MRLFSTIALCSLCLLLVGCGLARPKKAVVVPKERGWALMMPELMKGDAGTASTSAPPEGGTATTMAPEGGMFDFSSAMSEHNTTPGSVGWKQSATEAIALSKVSGKPLLIFFSSQFSAPSGTMARTFLLTPDFRELVEKSYIPLRVDYSDKETRGSDFYKAFKGRLAPRGYPTLLIILPDGAEIMRLSGYKTEYAKSYQQRISNAVEQCKKAVAERRTKMMKQGYRLWTDKKGVEVFAKLIGLDANIGTFTGEWGANFTFFITRLTDKDQAWIEEQKRLRQGT